MKFCKHCGAELLDEAVVCPKCGCSVETKKEEPKAPVAGPKSGLTASIVGLVVGLFTAILSFFLVIAGIPFFIVEAVFVIIGLVRSIKAFKTDKKDKKALAALIISAVSLLICVLVLAWIILVFTVL